MNYTSEEIFEDSIHQMNAANFIFIDAGSVFSDGTKIHRNACGWLAIHAALHYNAYMHQLSPPTSLKMIYYEYLPQKLKEYSIPQSSRTDDYYFIECDLAHLTALSESRILHNPLKVHYRNIEHILPPLEPQTSNSHQNMIHIWLANHHYYAAIPGGRERLQYAQTKTNVTAFVAKYPQLYKLFTDPLIANDEALARILQDEENIPT